MHEWQVTVLQRPCCGYVGVARNIEDANNRGDYQKFHDSGTCVGVNNFSGERNAVSELYKEKRRGENKMREL